MYERGRVRSVLAALSTAALITLATVQRRPPLPVGLSLFFENSKMAPVTLTGNYLVSVKARREYGGVALKCAMPLEIQVGTPLKSLFTAKAGKCGDCYKENAGFTHILHGASNWRACFSCYHSLAFAPSKVLDLRLYTIHDRSARFRAMGDSNNDCSRCHLTTPTGRRGVC